MKSLTIAQTAKLLSTTTKQVQADIATGAPIGANGRVDLLVAGWPRAEVEWMSPHLP